MRLIFLALSVILFSSSAGAGEAETEPVFAEGDEFEIISSYETRSEGEGTSGSSRGTDAYLESILSVELNGVLREFDVRLEADEERKLINWQFPAQVWDRAGQGSSLGNRTELEARRDAWLAAAELTPEACGKHYFTWNVFKVECDPDDILALIDELDLTKVGIQDGALIDHPGVSSAAKLNRLADENGLEVYEAEFEIDPDHVRASRAEAAVVVAEILGKPTTLADAQAEQSSIAYSGDITVRFEISTDRDLMRRIVESNLFVVDAEGGMENEYAKRIVERKRAGNRSLRPS